MKLRVQRDKNQFLYANAAAMEVIFVRLPNIKPITAIKGNELNWLEHFVIPF
jgi:hypothetical protein